MPTTLSAFKILSALSSDVLGSLLDLCDGPSLFCLVLCGNQSLNKKAFASVRSFTHIYKPGWRQTWPTILSRFSALARVSLSSHYPEHDDDVLGVDIMSLPSSLRYLKLGFGNGLLSLLHLPPADYIDGPFSAHLLPSFLDKFVNLEQLDWASDYGKQLSQWNFTPLLEELSRSSIFIRLLPITTFGYNESTLGTLPNGIMSLRLPFLANWKDPFSFPTSMTQLSMKMPSCPDILLRAISSTLRQLEVILEAPYVSEKQSISICASLSSLLPHLDVLRLTYDFFTLDLIQNLPRNLTELELNTSIWDFEWLALLPPLLTSVTFWCSRFLLGPPWDHKVELCEELDRAFERGRGCWEDLPEKRLETIRDDLVLKLPRGLTNIPKLWLSYVPPKHWDALPPGLTEMTCPVEELPLSAPLVPHLVISGSAPDHSHSTKYISLLPPNLKAFKLIGGVEPEDVEKLVSPPAVTQLTLDLSYPPASRAIDDSSTNTEKAVVLRQYSRDMLKACSRFKNLQILELTISEPFELDDFKELGTYTSHLTIHLAVPSYVRSVAETWPNRDIRVDSSSPTSSLTSFSSSLDFPNCLKHLTELYISSPSFLFKFCPSLLSLLSLPSLETLLVKSIMVHEDILNIEAQNRLNEFRSDWISLFAAPSILRHLEVNLDRIDDHTIQSLPQSLKVLDLNNSQVRHGWEYQAISKLPKRLERLHLPISCAGADDEVEEAQSNVMEILALIPSHHHLSRVTMGERVVAIPNLELPSKPLFLLARAPHVLTLSDIIAKERRSRQRAEMRRTGTASRQASPPPPASHVSGDNDDPIELSAPKSNRKRKHD